MPGKLNPVIPELVMQVSFEVRGMATIVEAAAAAGELELNVMEPVIARHLLQALRDLGIVAETFATRCILGLTWNDDAVQRNLGGSYASLVAAAERHGYAAAAAGRHGGPGSSDPEP
jgi:aspartate ammonia-lyase